MSDQLDPIDPNIGTIVPRILETEMQESYLDYAMSVIVSRALPDVRDGLKPVHRRILYAMWDQGQRAGSHRSKSAAVVGEVLKKYHPHGDIAVYDSLVRMAQDFAMRYRLVDGQGNFGSIDGHSAAAMRYTEARMTQISEELLFDIEKETVDFIPNYDGTTEEPKVLPSKLPQLLLNGTVGIAVGMATNIPPHNLAELCEAVILLIEKPETTAEELFALVPGPDFPTGGHIYDQEEIKLCYTTGRGKVVMRGTAEIEENKRGFQIIVSEIPYQVNKATLIEKIADLVKNKKLEGITDIRDESDREGIRIVIELGKNAYPKKVLNRLFDLTSLQTTFHVNMLALVGGIEPKVLTLKELLEQFILHRREVVRRRAEYELKVARSRAHIVEGLRIALKHIDEVIATIKKAASREDAQVKLIARFKLTDLQANAILEMRLSQLAALERQRIEDEYVALTKRIDELEALLKSEAKILAVVKSETKEIKDRYGDERRTKIHSEKLGDFSAKDLIPEESMIILLTTDNYIKRMPPTVYRAQGRGGKGVMGMTTKEDDAVGYLLSASTHDDLYVFTDRGRVFRTKVYELPQALRAAKGQALVNMIQMAPDEKVTTLLTLKEGKKQTGKYLYFATERGMVKKTDLKAYEKVRKTGMQAIRLSPGDVLRWVKVTSGTDDIFEVSAGGLAMRYREEDVRAMGRGAAGVRGMKLKDGDKVVSMDAVARDDPEAQMLIVLENGYGKRTKTAQFSLHHRGGQGMRVANVTGRAGKVVTGQVLHDDAGDLLIVASKGQTIRMKLKSVKQLSREAQGVILMRSTSSDKVASVTVIPTEEIVEEPGTANERAGGISSEVSSGSSEVEEPAKKLAKPVRKSTSQKPTQEKLPKKRSK